MQFPVKLDLISIFVWCINIDKNLYFNVYLFLGDNAPIKSKLQHPPNPGKLQVFDYFLFPGSGEFDLRLVGVGKIEPEV